MPYRKRTLRRLTPEARKLARLVGGLEGLATRLKNLVPVMQTLEMLARAEAKRQASLEQQGQPKPAGKGLFGDD